MSLNDEVKNSINKLTEDSEEIKKLLKLLLVNNLVDDISNVVTYDDTVDEETATILDRYSIKAGKVEVLLGTHLLVIHTPSSLKFKDIQMIYEWFDTRLPNIEPIFEFTKLNGMKRKRMIEEHISFYISNHEFCIFSSKGNESWK